MYGTDAVKSERDGGIAMSVSRFLLVLASAVLSAFSAVPKEKTKFF